MPLQKWKLLSAKDVSPSPWFPIEERTYQLPNGKIVDDFTVTTLADVSLIIPITTDKKIIIANQYKPGVDEVVMQFPGGRLEPHHHDPTELAQHELEEELGIKVKRDQLTQFAKFSGFSTKATEIVNFFIAQNCEFNSTQHLDSTEEIEILSFDPAEIDELMASNQIWCSQSVAGWYVAKQKFPDLLS